MSNKGNLCRDGIFGNLSIKGRTIIDEKRNITAKEIRAKDIKTKSLITTNGATIKGGLTVESQTNRILNSKKLKEADFTRRSQSAPNPNDQYDIIVCGAGTAGSLLTFRLAERYPNTKILLLDMGQDDVRETTVTPNPNAPGDDWGQLMRNFFSLLGEGCQSLQDVIKTPNYHEEISVPINHATGATFGGTSAVNALIWNRGTKEGTYDAWEEIAGSDFGFDAMNESFKAIESRSQDVRVNSGPPTLLWQSPGPTPSRTLNTDYHGTGAPTNGAGKIFLSQAIVPGATSNALREILQESPLPGRDNVIPIDLDAEDPTNPVEHSFTAIETSYEQSGSLFPTINPYPPTTPGYTYTPPADVSNAKGPEYAGPPDAIRSALPSIGYKYLTARCYAAPAFLYPILDNNIPHNVTVVPRAFVTKLLFTNPEDPTECTGVEWVEDGWHVMNVNRAIKRDAPQYRGTISDVDKTDCTSNAAAINQLSVTKKEAFASADVWVCLGAKHTPRLLQLSGIGDRKHLESIRKGPKIECRLNLPGVGATVQDTLDMCIGYLQEQNWSTGLPPPLPAGIFEFIWGNYAGFADATNPLNPALTASVGGIPYEKYHIFRGRSTPNKNYNDFEILTQTPGAAGLGGLTWKDIADVVILAKNVDIDINLIKPLFDRYRWGLNNNGVVDTVVDKNGLFTEYWDLSSYGEVKINSGDPYDMATYSPNLLSNEQDIEANVALFENTILPIMKRFSQKRNSVRGFVTYVGTASAGGVNTITLLPTLVQARPFVGPGLINQGTYDTIGSLNGYIISIVSGTGAGQNNVIVNWTGSGGGYIATVLAPWGIVPDATSVYGINPPNSSPSDVMDFTGNDNYRVCSGLFRPNGDQCLNTVEFETLPSDPFTTVTYLDVGLPYPVQPATRIGVNHPSHNLDETDIIKISGVTGNVNGIDAVHFNDYHFIDNVIDANNYEIVLKWNVTPVDSSPIPSPGISSVAGTGGGSEVRVDKMVFNEIKFRKWFKQTYFSGWHPCCSCRMGRPDDENAVVDTRARVYDTKGLRIADASIFPKKPNANTQAPVYGITQRLFELISVEEYDNLLA